MRASRFRPRFRIEREMVPQMSVIGAYGADVSSLNTGQPPNRGLASPLRARRTVSPGPTYTGHPGNRPLPITNPPLPSYPDPAVNRDESRAPTLLLPASRLSPRRGAYARRNPLTGRCRGTLLPGTARKGGGQFRAHPYLCLSRPPAPYPPPPGTPGLPRLGRDPGCCTPCWTATRPRAASPG